MHFLGETLIFGIVFVVHNESHYFGKRYLSNEKTTVISQNLPLIG